ncbi:MAG: hypothetical protein FWG72_07985 [Oscillospiraceae bacterium]|nr:hypothetical protein [Oscillospiraceae bacterium]
MKLELETLDERQTLMTRKYGYQSFLLLIALVLINAFICEVVYVWAEPMVSALFVVYIALLYFAIRTQLRVGIGKIKSKWKFALAMVPFALIGGVMGYAAATPGEAGLIADGKATINLWILFFLFWAILVVAAVIIRRRRDKRDGNQAERSDGR